jgi:hypothetical protein
LACLGRDGHRPLSPLQASDAHTGTEAKAQAMTIGTVVYILRLPEYGNGIVVDITKAGLLRVVFDDDYCDAFHPLELELAERYPVAA